ncbi:hypothetical protein BKA70DRAFT_1512198 [Coprinopsis sp. MPI-PUGE-AT-0042]|nr:hypothetical protein BKA70DRAFT_1512198 [Coprinopsis sp. MPI-PUGE-AT-0042]
MSSAHRADTMGTHQNPYLYMLASTRGSYTGAVVGSSSLPHPTRQPLIGINGVPASRGGHNPAWPSATHYEPSLHSGLSHVLGAEQVVGQSQGSFFGASLASSARQVTSPSRSQPLPTPPGLQQSVPPSYSDPWAALSHSQLAAISKQTVGPSIAQASYHPLPQRPTTSETASSSSLPLAQYVSTSSARWVDDEDIEFIGYGKPACDQPVQQSVTIGKHHPLVGDSTKGLGKQACDKSVQQPTTKEWQRPLVRDTTKPSQYSWLAPASLAPTIPTPASTQPSTSVQTHMTDVADKGKGKARAPAKKSSVPPQAQSQRVVNGKVYVPLRAPNHGETAREYRKYLDDVRPDDIRERLGDGVKIKPEKARNKWRDIWFNNAPRGNANLKFVSELSSTPKSRKRSLTSNPKRSIDAVTDQEDPARKKIKLGPSNWEHSSWPVSASPSPPVAAFTQLPTVANDKKDNAADDHEEEDWLAADLAEDGEQTDHTAVEGNAGDETDDLFANKKNWLDKELDNTWEEKKEKKQEEEVSALTVPSPTLTAVAPSPANDGELDDTKEHKDSYFDDLFEEKDEDDSQGVATSDDSSEGQHDWLAESFAEDEEVGNEETVDKEHDDDGDDEDDDDLELVDCEAYHVNEDGQKEEEENKEEVDVGLDFDSYYELCSDDEKEEKENEEERDEDTDDDYDSNDSECEE